MIEIVKKISWLVFSIVLIMCYSINSFAQTESGIKDAKTAVGSVISPEEAQIAVQKQHPGVILRIWQKSYKGRKAYYVRVLSPHGRVHTHIVDARTAVLIR